MRHFIFLEKIPSCEEADEVDVDEWSSTHFEGNKEIVSLITQDFDEKPDTIYDVYDT